MAKSANLILTNHSKCSKSLVVAKESDILFKPLADGGVSVLEIQKEKLRVKKQFHIDNFSFLKEDDEKAHLSYLLTLDPANWKDQDHYAVIGLKKARYLATDEDIRKAYRAQVLRHHPDKRQAQGEIINPDGDYFACIVKAYEILSVPLKRKAFDSIDPYYEDWTPSKVIADADDFFTIFGTWFCMYSKFSNIQPVPILGNMNSTREAVEEFYEFWYSFDSWREYSYLDEEDKDKGQYREERRWIEKQNKLARAKRKKEDSLKTRKIVDIAYNYDPRIKMYMEFDKQEKLAKKQERQNAVRMKHMEEQKILIETAEKEQREKAEKEAIEKEQELAIKREREAMRKSLRKERKIFRTFCKDRNYFTEKDSDIVRNMTLVEDLCDKLALLELESLNKEMLATRSEDAAKELFFTKTGLSLPKQDEKPKMNGEGEKLWSPEEQKQFEAALKTYSKSDPQRWVRVAEAVPGRTKKECRDRFRELAALVKAKRDGTTLDGEDPGEK